MGVSRNRQGKTPRVVTSCCARAEDGLQHVEISDEWVCIRRRIAGLETRVNVPKQSYSGVTLRAAPGDRFEIVLLHVDPSLDVVLARAPDDRDVIALWRTFGRNIALPLLAEDADGRLRAMEETSPPPQARRLGSALRRRRPRFLARREPGAATMTHVHRGESDFCTHA
jgi:Family of unknown function (DUF6101)